ncbi:PREDICTED: 40S ribosomal protein S2-like [Priapulus caudatus]|nr:PREDICTED: 40S ribosomal protein S2-like [Priapulus caudatus]
MAGIEDCYTSARGSTSTLGNFAKATYEAIARTYSYLTPDLWKETVFTKPPYQEFTDYLAQTHARVAAAAAAAAEPETRPY